jgi:hypothetical protein
MKQDRKQQNSRIPRKLGLPAETRVSGAAATDQLQINILGGNDRVQVDNAAGTLIGVLVDLGTGQR